CTCSNDHERAEGSGANGLCALLGVKSLRVVNEKWHDGQRVDDGNQGNQWLKVHGAMGGQVAKKGKKGLSGTQIACTGQCGLHRRDPGVGHLHSCMMHDPEEHAIKEMAVWAM